MAKRMYSHKKKAATAALCAAFALLSTTSVLAAEPADIMGKTITAVKIEGESTVQEADIYAVLALKPGDVAETTALQTDLKAVYDMGYFYNASIDFQEVPEGVEVIYVVEENPVLQSVAFDGNISATAEELDALVTNPRGEVLNTKLLAQNTKQIEKFYHDKGNILAKVTDVKMENDGLLRLKINEGILEGFSVKGNEKTKDYVILREMRMTPGEPFNVNEARRSVQRINNLGYFEDVNVKLNPGTEPNSVILETSVIEQRTGTFSIGAGYSDTEGMVGLIELGDRNFLGRGDNAKIAWEFGGDADEYKNYEVSYTHPWADSKGSAIGLSFYDRVTEYDDYDIGGHRRSTYDKQRKGLDIYYSRPMTEYSTNYLTLRTRDDSYDGHVGGRVDYSKPAGAPGMGQYHNDFMTKYPNYIEDNFGRTNSLSFSHVTDTRDNVFNAMEGHRASMTLELAGGPLGGDFDFQKFTLEDRRYYRVGRAHVIALRGMVGYGMGDMPESGQFSVGGTETLRGFEDEQFQGKKMYLINAEYRFPIAKKLQGVVFADTGNAWDGIIDDDNGMSDLNVGYGVGIRFQSPLGPIRLDFGKGDSGGGFKTHFSFAGQF